MSKKLESILQKVPPATVASFNKEIKSEEKVLIEEEQIVRLIAQVPFKVKRRLKQYVAENPGETERSAILKGLKLLGIKVEDKYLHDLRSTRN